MRSWPTRRWQKGSPRFSARCPPGPDAVCRYLLTPDPNPRDPMIQTTKVAHRTIKARDLDIFYREAGPKDAPAGLLLHGFPTSSQVFRNLIPALAGRYRVLAPDYPGFGHNSMPPRDEFAYTFDNLAGVVEEFTAMLGRRHSVRVSLSNKESRWQPSPVPMCSAKTAFPRGKF